MKEITNIKDTATYYYDMLRDNQPKIIEKLEAHLPFYRFTYQKKVKSREIIYDTPKKLLASAGLVLSKVFDGEKHYIILTKVSYLPKQFKKPSVVLFKAECSPQDVPNMYPIKLAGVITDATPGIFTVDLVEVIKIVVPRIEINVQGDKYEIASGTGYRAEMLFEEVFYRDLATKGKFSHKNAAFVLSALEKDKKSNNEILGAVLRYCKELFPYEETRFEIARRVLAARQGEKKKFNKKDFKKNKKQETEENKEE